MVQDQRMTIRQAAAVLKIEERRAQWLLENG
jgi:phage antirepressor YoqD-like protein